ncbi:hypothetical protein NC652_039314 [Populus alba x Populus x berolinensis]|nr:hypothetical protein NC652_039314 [Populus alba x Populus x berolinensis]
MCFMAIKSYNEVLFSDDEYDIYYNELHSIFETLYDEYKKLGSEYSLLKKIHAYLLIKKYILKKKACIAVNDCDKMNRRIEENKA